jgi:peptide/nickel transport system substrate-binding protein
LSLHLAVIARLLHFREESSANICALSAMVQRLVEKRRGRQPACVAIVCALAFGCARPSPPPPRYLQVDIETSPISTDPRVATDVFSSRVNELVFDSLVRIDERGQFVPDLAESIERPDDLRIVFHLKRGIRFSDGREFTARDVKFTYQSILDPALRSAKRGGLKQLKSIEAPDDYTIVMTTWGPYAPAMEMGMYGIVPQGTPPASATAVSPPGTGPFRMTRYTRDDSVWLQRNPYRPGPEGSPEGIVFKIVPDPTVRALELTEGVCDVAPNDVEPEVLPYLLAQANIAVNEAPGTTYQYLMFNFRNPALRDLRVRRAIAYAIDRKAIVKSFLRGTARLASGMLTPENWAFDGNVTLYDYDPATANRLLDDAGYPRGEDGMRVLKLIYKTTPEGGRLGEAIQAMLRQVGIRVFIRSNEFATFLGDLDKGNFDITSLRWIGINDPNHYYLVLDSGMTPAQGGSNRGAYANTHMDALVERGMHTIDPSARRSIYAEVQQLAAADLPYVSLWWLQNVTVLNREVQGFEPRANGSLRSLATVEIVAPSGAETGE